MLGKSSQCGRKSKMNVVKEPQIPSETDKSNSQCNKLLEYS